MRFPTASLIGVLLLLPTAHLSAANAGVVPPRPRITGISHAAFFVSDMAKARALGFLDFASPFSIPRKNPNEHLVWIKINDRQSVELFPGSEVAPDADRLYHVAIEVEDADAMLAYLRAKGVAGLPRAPSARSATRTSRSRIPTATPWKSCNTCPMAGRCAKKGSTCRPREFRSA